MNDEPEMVLIPSGIMPTVPTVGFREDFSGQQVDAFEIGKYAVTLAEWENLMDYTPSDADNLFLGQPVININWYDAHRYIDKLNQRTGEQYRLPTELEWEYAARAGTSNDYHVPREAVLEGKVISFEKNNQGPVAVGSFPPNKWGCYEMLGNLWEWVSDGGRTVPGFDGSDSTELNVVRGGCWASSEFEVKLTARDEHPKEGNYWGTFGFRLAKGI